jgi:hypothetical protein
VKTLRLKIGFLEFSLRIGSRGQTPPLEIKRYEVAPAALVPKIHQGLLRRLKSKIRAQVPPAVNGSPGSRYPPDSTTRHGQMVGFAAGGTGSPPLNQGLAGPCSRRRWRYQLPASRGHRT